MFTFEFDHYGKIVRAAPMAAGVQSDRRRNLVVLNRLFFELVGAAFQPRLPGSSRLESRSHQSFMAAQQTLNLM